MYKRRSFLLSATLAKQHYAITPTQSENHNASSLGMSSGDSESESAKSITPESLLDAGRDALEERAAPFALLRDLLEDGERLK